MRTFYKNVLTLLATTSALMMSQLSEAALNGTYTIDASQAASATNYQNIASATRDLRGLSRTDGGAANGSGVSGPVVFKMKGTFNEKMDLFYVNGVSATNTITFDGQGATTITNGASYSARHVVRFNDGAERYTVKNCKIVSTGTSYAWGVHFYRYNRYCNLDSNEIDLSSATSGSYNNTVGVVVSRLTTGTQHSSYSDYGSSRCARDINIRANHIHGKGSGSPNGPTTGISTSNNYYFYNTRINFNINIEGNRIVDFKSYGIRNYRTNDCKMVRNEITRPNNTDQPTIYGIYDYYGGRRMVIDGNKIHNLRGSNPNDFSTLYGIYLYYGYGGSNYYSGGQGSKIVNNAIYNIKSGGTIYGIRGYYYYYKTEFSHNTISIDNSAYSGTRNSYNAYWYYVGYNYTASERFNCYNNIFTNTRGTSTTARYGLYIYTRYTNLHIDNNNTYVPNSTRTYYFNNVGYANAAAATAGMTDWGTPGGTGKVCENGLNVDPVYDNVETDVEPGFPMDNKGMANGAVTNDVNNAKRNASTPDIGAYEFSIPIALDSFELTGTNECGGYMETMVVKVKNLSTKDVKGDLPLSISDGKTTKSELFSANIGAGKSQTFTFSNPYQFNRPGKNYITAKIEHNDGSLLDNEITDSINITSSPSGAELVDGSGFEGYFRAGNMKAPDVAAPDYDNEYEIIPPSKYSSANYGTDWTLDNISATPSGTTDSAGFTFSAPSANGNGTLTYNPSRSMQDSVIYIAMRINDLNTGCDSIIGRYVYIPNIPVASFIHKDVCDGNAVEFENTSKIAMGENMLFNWNFGDINASDDSSALIDPFYQYVTYGRFNAVMSAVNANYTKFKYYDTASVLITPSPAVDFKAFSACEGEDITFNNLSSDPANSGSTITYLWEFGDNTTDTKTSPVKQYNKPGTYQIKLIATMNGCTNEIVKNANQFAKPVVSEFTTSGTCNLEDISFTNNTSISIGKSGYVWDLGDGNISTAANPIHSYSTPGDKTVKLLAVSEFGCVDSFEKVITLAESPVADFDYNAPCNLDPVTFKNNSKEPTGDNTVYLWDFNGEGLSTDKIPSFKFAELGLKAVTLTATAKNSGCQATIVKEFNVLLQPEASFTVGNVCDEEEAVFINTSKVAAGNLDYNWSFGDGTSSTDAAPRHAYDISGNAKNFEVILVASSKGACADTFSQNIFVNPKPDAGFTSSVSGRVATFTPNDVSAGLSYFWRFGDGGQSTDASPTYEYVNVEGSTSYNATLYLVNNSGCADEVSNAVSFENFIGVENLEFNNKLFNVYPNPNNGIFNLEIDAENVESIVVLDMTGKTVSAKVSQRNGTYTINMDGISAGVYNVKVLADNTLGIQKITVTK